MAVRTKAPAPKEPVRVSPRYPQFHCPWAAAETAARAAYNGIHPPADRCPDARHPHRRQPQRAAPPTEAVKGAARGNNKHNKMISSRSGFMGIPMMHRDACGHSPCCEFSHTVFPHNWKMHDESTRKIIFTGLANTRDARLETRDWRLDWRVEQAKPATSSLQNQKIE